MRFSSRRCRFTRVGCGKACSRLNQRKKSALLLLSAAAVIVTGSAGCGQGEAEGSQPTVLETDAALPGDTAETEDVIGDDSADSESADSEGEPVPASSEGPAQNWPAPEPPEEIYEDSEEGAEALIQYWFDVRHYARVTGDTEPLEDVSHEECEVCSVQIERVEEIYPGGWFVEEEPFSVADLEVVGNEAGEILVDFLLTEHRFELYEEGELLEESPDVAPARFDAYLVFDGGSWELTEFGYAAEPNGSESAG